MLTTVGLFGLVAAPVVIGNPNQYQKADETWISISGTAVDTKADSFILDYGQGIITVEMGDGLVNPAGHA